MKMYKVALALDLDDAPCLGEELKAVYAIREADLHENRHTPDNTYTVYYWEDIQWDAECVKPLLKKLENVRHALISISEEGEIWQDILVEDNRGIDEAFYELLSWDADICFWSAKEPLAPLKDYYPISRERLISILRSYISNDYAGMAETSYLYDALKSAGANDDEIEALGFDFCFSEKEEVE